MAKILVTGGSGLVGRHLKEALPEATYVSSADFDLTVEDDVARLCSDRWDHIVHLAARVGGIIDNMMHPAEFIEQNLLMNSLLLKHARLSKVPRLTAVLSTCIYPDVATAYPLTEGQLHEGPPQATNFPYAVAKRALASQIDAYRAQYGLKYHYLIPCNLYGLYDNWNPEKSHFLPAIIMKIVNAENDGSGVVRLLGSGRPLRQLMYASDLAKVIRRCVIEEVDASFNVATKENLSIREIAEIALAACGKGDFKLIFDNTSPDGQFRKDVSTELMEATLGTVEMTPLAEGIKAVYGHYRKSRQP